jgi:diguanylate cyclase (GGDEF)-like protein/PAS domain S-box-containing protein
MQAWAYPAAAAFFGLVAIAAWLCLRAYTRLYHQAVTSVHGVQAMQAVMLASGDAIILEDAQGHITHWSAGAQALFGYTPGEMLGQTRQRLIPPEQAQQDAHITAKLDDPSAAQKDALIKSTGSVRIGKSGEAVSVAITYTALLDAQGKRTGLCCVMRDTRRQTVADELIRSMSFNDALTGLPNWRLLRDRLWRAQLHSGRQGSYFAVLYVDLDDFKAVNDIYGHDAGNQLLVEVSARLMAAVRQKDTVARLAGDEFVVLLEDLGTEEFPARNHANAVADKVLDLMEGRIFKLGDVQVQCTASIGIQVMQGGNGHVDQLIKEADAAMARVKKGRRMVARGDYVGKASG